MSLVCDGAGAGPGPAGGSRAPVRGIATVNWMKCEGSLL